MDICTLTASGIVGKVHGWRRAGNRDCYRFSLAINRRIARQTVSVLWLQCSVFNPLSEHVAERGIFVGERLLITSDDLELVAVLHEKQPRPFLNITVSQVVFVSEPPIAEIIRVGGTVRSIAKGSKVS